MELSMLIVAIHLPIIDFRWRRRRTHVIFLLRGPWVFRNHFRSDNLQNIPGSVLSTAYSNAQVNVRKTWCNNSWSRESMIVRWLCEQPFRACLGWRSVLSIYRVTRRNRILLWGCQLLTSITNLAEMAGSYFPVYRFKISFLLYY